MDGDVHGSCLLGEVTFDTHIVATAQFDAANVDPIETTGATSGSALGGAATTGGVDVSFDNVNTTGTLSAQNIDTTGLSQDAVAAAEAVANFKTAGNTPQIWEVGYDGDYDGDLTLTFGYDENQLGGIAEEDLYIWHFDDDLDDWEKVFGTVDTVANTITVSADSLSPFALGVPEPSSLCLLALGALCGCLFRWCRGKQSWAIRR